MYNCKPIFDIFRTTFEEHTLEKKKITRYFITNSDGYWIKGPKPEDEFSFLFKSVPSKRFLHLYPEAWEKITAEQTGQIFVKDGLFTFTTFYPAIRVKKVSEQSSAGFDVMPSESIHSFSNMWKIISFVPLDLCTISSVTRLKEFLLYDSVLVLFFLVASWFMARASVRKEYVEKALQYLSVSDPMTGLYNRRGFFLLAQQQLKIAERINQNMALFFFDLDDFKSINDRFGHQEGDAVLKKTAEILKITFRQSDILCRAGGDEFVALVIQNTPVDIEAISMRLEKNLEEINSKIGKGYKVSLSFGVANYDPLKGQTIDNLISIADRIMYTQKQKKKKFNQAEKGSR